MRWRRTLVRVLDGNHDASIRFDDLCQMLRRLGFSERIRGSHHVFSHPEVTARVVLQSDGPSAKVYQVRQVRQVIHRHGLGELDT